MFNVEAAMYAADGLSVGQSTYYGIASLFVALATLVGAVASYKSIVNKSSVMSYDKLEERLEKDREKYNTRIDDQDKRHKDQLEEIAETYRVDLAEQEKRHRAEIGDVSNELYDVQTELRRIGRVVEISKAHTLNQEAIIKGLGADPAPMPIELRLFNAAPDGHVERGS